MAHINKWDLERFAKMAASQYVSDGRDLSESIFELAGQHQFNNEQVKRVVEAANTITNGELVRMAKQAGRDPRIDFPLADADKILGMILGQSEVVKQAEARHVEKLDGMFDIREQAPPLEKRADSQKTKRLSMKSGPEIAAAYVQGVDLSGEDFTIGQLVDASDSVDEFLATTNTKLAEHRNDDDQLLSAIRKEASSQIHAGVTPATLHDIVNKIDVLDAHKKLAHDQIDEIAAEMDVGIGKTQLKPESIIDPDSELVQALSCMMEVDADRYLTMTMGQKLASAKQRIRADINRAESEGQTKIAFVPSTAGLGKAISAAPKAVGTAFNGLNVFGNATESFNRAAEATKRLKRAQMTPPVGPMKMAALNPTLGTVAVHALAAAGAFTVMAHADKALNALEGSVGGIFERRKRNKMFENLIQREPELGRNPKAREYFDLIMQYAPALGDHPLAIGDFLKKQLQYPVTSVEFLQHLANLQKTIRDGRSTSTHPAIEGARGVFSAAQGQWIKS